MFILIYDKKIVFLVFSSRYLHLVTHCQSLSAHSMNRKCEFFRALHGKTKTISWNSPSLRTARPAQAVKESASYNGDMHYRAQGDPLTRTHIRIQTSHRPLRRHLEHPRGRVVISSHNEKPSSLNPSSFQAQQKIFGLLHIRYTFSFVFFPSITQI